MTDPRPKFVLPRARIVGRGRRVTRDELTAQCTLAVWLPAQVPPDLVEVHYFIMDYDRQFIMDYDRQPNASYSARFNPTRSRSLTISGHSIGFFPPGTRSGSQDGVTRINLERDGTDVLIAGKDLSEAELDEVVESLQRVQPTSD